MEDIHYKADLYPEALNLFKAKKITSLDKIRELLSINYPGNTAAIEDAMQRLRGYRKSRGIRYMIIGAVLTPVGIVVTSLLWNKGGIIDMAIIGALLGGGIGLLIQGAKEYFTMK
ncbi:hypothetical protein [Prevotella sp. 10(H)]|uniref:hypothetical protein n=1 Tax=Prevotella sp. 10(H) TaxID=1158294 RepID=UPI0004A78664|nr:hypothetical protein [Prevotella sp. 10(H)]